MSESVVKPKSLPMPLKGQDPQDWADYAESCRASNMPLGVEIGKFIKYQLRLPGGSVPQRLSVVVVASEPRSGSTSVRVDAGDRREYVAACRAADTTVEREVRRLVRFQLGRAGARAPERLVGR